MVVVSVYTVVVLGDTDLLPAEATAPIPLSIIIDVAPLMLQLKVAAFPAFIRGGLALKETITGAPEGKMATCAVAVTLVPFDLVAISVYVVVLTGDTTIAPDDEISPMPWSMLTFVAPVTFQTSFADSPA